MVAVARRTLKKEPTGEKPSSGRYFVPDADIAFFSSGSKLLDLALGGGWAERRVSNIVGDSSTGKTLLAIEACVNFKRKYPKGKVRYREGEAAFSKDYVTTKLGMPLDDVDFGEDNPDEAGPLTIEDLYEELEYRIQHSKTPELMVIDSLDSVSTRAEMARKIDEGSYGTEKSRQMSALFRRINFAMSEKDITMMIVSQTRDNIGATMFSRKWKISGGNALKFYTTQRVALSQLKKLEKTHRGITRAIGIQIKAYIDKNKASSAYLDIQFPILFNYGIDDEASCRDFLKKLKINGMEKASRDKLHQTVEKEWVSLLEAFDPGRRKYG